MQTIQNRAGGQLLAEHQPRAYVTGTHSVFHPQIESSELREYYLITHGKLLAKMLAQTLDQLRAYNEEAVYPIVSILEPYMEITQELDLRMPPISSRKVTLNVTDRGRAEPDLDLE